MKVFIFKSLDHFSVITFASWRFLIMSLLLRHNSWLLWIHLNKMASRNNGLSLLFSILVHFIEKEWSIKYYLFNNNTIGIRELLRFVMKKKKEIQIIPLKQNTNYCLHMIPILYSHNYMSTKFSFRNHSYSLIDNMYQ